MTRRSSTGWLAAAILLALPVLPAAAQPSANHVFSVHDLDRDGRLSRSEYQMLLDYRQRWSSRGRGWHRLLDFDAIDIDRDNYIGEEELAAALVGHWQERRHRRFRGGWGDGRH